MTSIQAAGWIVAAFLAGCGVGPLLQAAFRAVGRWISRRVGPVLAASGGRANGPPRSAGLQNAGPAGNSAARPGARSDSRSDPAAAAEREVLPLSPEQQAQVERFRREWQSFLEYDGFPGGRL